jgi:hypothetical protein
MKEWSLPHHKIIKRLCYCFYKNEGNREIIYGNCIAVSRPDRITPITHWILGSKDKNRVYPTTQILNGVALFSIKMKDIEK